MALNRLGTILLIGGLVIAVISGLVLADTADRLYTAQSESTISPEITGDITVPDEDATSESLVVEIVSLDSDTTLLLEGSGWLLYNTMIGGDDNVSDVYVIVSLNGQRVNVTSLAVSLMLGELDFVYNFWWLETGVYDLWVEVPRGLEAGSYLAIVDVTYADGLITYNGTGSYLLHCTDKITA